MNGCDWKAIVDRHYSNAPEARAILIEHSASVAALAEQIARERNLDIDPEELHAAAMLHDIGIVATNAPSIGCRGTLPYLCHGVAGADMLRADGAPEWIARVAERHTGAGLTHEEIAAAGLPLPPDRTYMPETTLEKLICYADCFYSKGGDGQRKSLARVRASMAKFGPGVAERFEKLHNLFGIEAIKDA